MTIVLDCAAAARAGLQVTRAIIQFDAQPQQACATAPRRVRSKLHRVAVIREKLLASAIYIKMRDVSLVGTEFRPREPAVIHAFPLHLSRGFDASGIHTQVMS